MKAVPCIPVPASKSIGNRLLVLGKIFPHIRFSPRPDARDTRLLREALYAAGDTIDVRDAGTAMRFATAYWAFMTRTPKLIRGTERMHRRPIGPLVDALNRLGGRVSYAGTSGFPPLRIEASESIRRGGSLEIPGTVSSQFITALMLTAPLTRRGIRLHLTGEIVSRPYLQMTASLLRQAGIPVDFDLPRIAVYPPQDYPEHHFRVESDWSAASYFYARTALTGKPVCLKSFPPQSVQGDAIVEKLFRPLGVQTRRAGDRLHLSAVPYIKPSFWQVDCADYPDLAPTLAVTCYGLQIPCRLVGLQTLRIKETDRIEALATELARLGAQVETGPYWLRLEPPAAFPRFRGTIRTYDDHRMSMAFAVLQDLFPDMQIQDPGNVAKSYPAFWTHWKSY